MADVVGPLGKIKFIAMTAEVVAVCMCGNRIPFQFTTIAGRAPFKQQCAICQTIYHVAQIHFDTRNLERQVCNVDFAIELPNILKPA